MPERLYTLAACLRTVEIPEVSAVLLTLPMGFPSKASQPSGRSPGRTPSVLSRSHGICVSVLGARFRTRAPRLVRLHDLCVHASVIERRSKHG